MGTQDTTDNDDLSGLTEDERAQLAELEGADLTAITVPETAVLQKDGKAHVWLVDAKEGAVHLAPIETGAVSNRTVLVSSGLKAGDRVITQGLANVQPEKALRPVPASAPQTIQPPKAGAAPRAGGG